MTFNEHYSQKSLNYAKELRKNMTDFEQRLWYYLRAKRFLGLKFKRQAPIGSYIVDFLCKEAKLIIELDGGQHNEDENIKKDLNRQKYLEDKGFKVLRFWNNEVNENLEGVLNSILENLQYHPLPLRERGEFLNNYAAGLLTSLKMTCKT